MSKFILFFLLFFPFFPAGAQLVNIESQRLQTDSIRFAGNANLSYTFQNNDGNKLNLFKTSGVAQIKSKNLKNSYLLLLNLEYTQANSNVLSNSAFTHFRYNKKLNNWLKWEIYEQLQYNRLLNLKSRFISGTGLRFKLTKGKIFKCYIGISGFYEYEETRDEINRFKNDFRMSDYLVLTLKFPKEKGELSISSYYQPLYGDFSDYRITNQSNLVLNLNKHFAFTTSFNLYFDRFPPQGINRQTMSIQNGFRYSF